MSVISNPTPTLFPVLQFADSHQHVCLYLVDMVETRKSEKSARGTIKPISSQSMDILT